MSLIHLQARAFDSKHFPFLCVLAALLVVLFGCQRQQSTQFDTRPTDEAAIRAASGEWMAAMAKKDLDRTMSFMAADIKAWWGGKEEQNKEVVRQDVAAAFADPNYALTWEIIQVKVSRSGDLAYEMGNYQETTSDARKKPQTIAGRYLTIWEKQVGGAWKAIADIGGQAK